MGYKRIRETGFSLVEMAVVMVILGLLLGSILGPLSKQQELRYRKQNDLQLREIETALLGFASVNGYLPCPATTTSNGDESRAGGNDCSTNSGFVPARRLGLNGAYDNNSRLLDAWNNPVRYQITNVDNWAYAKAIDSDTPPANLRVCQTAACTAANIVAENIPAMIIIDGEDGALATTSPDQLENQDADTNFVDRITSEGTGSEFDDQLRWIAPTTLLYQLAQSGQLNSN